MSRQTLAKQLLRLCQPLFLKSASLTMQTDATKIAFIERMLCQGKLPTCWNKTLTDGLLLNMDRAQSVGTMVTLEMSKLEVEVKKHDRQEHVLRKYSMENQRVKSMLRG
jgi:hypothetical protein